MHDVRHNLNARKVHMKLKTKLKKGARISKEMRYGGGVWAAQEGTKSKAVETATDNCWAHKLVVNWLIEPWINRYGMLHKTKLQGEAKRNFSFFLSISFLLNSRVRYSPFFVLKN
jgi:hypothetical protein